MESKKPRLVTEWGGLPSDKVRIYSLEGTLDEAVGVFSAERIANLSTLAKCFDVFHYSDDHEGSRRLSGSLERLYCVIKEGAMYHPQFGWFFLKDSPILAENLDSLAVEEQARKIVEVANRDMFIPVEKRKVLHPDDFNCGEMKESCIEYKNHDASILKWFGEDGTFAITGDRHRLNIYTPKPSSQTEFFQFVFNRGSSYSSHREERVVWEGKELSDGSISDSDGRYVPREEDVGAWSTNYRILAVRKSDLNDKKKPVLVLASFGYKIPKFNSK